mgnify:CR=1 FL=1
MPSIKDVQLSSESFSCKEDITVVGGTYGIPLSSVDIGILRRWLR